MELRVVPHDVLCDVLSLGILSTRQFQTMGARRWFDLLLQHNGAWWWTWSYLVEAGAIRL